MLLQIRGTYRAIPWIVATPLLSLRENSEIKAINSLKTMLGRGFRKGAASP
jgi:hypothetical protein